MKKAGLIFILFLGINSVFGQKKDTIKELYKPSSIQNPLTKKGVMFVFWGWNRAGFSKSDIVFKGNDYNFALHNVVAHDRPSDLSWDYINPGEVSKPQFNFRFAYFIKDNLALVGATDHMKYVMDQDQTVDITGNISNPVYASMIQNGKIDLSDEKFLTFEHTDG